MGNRFLKRRGEGPGTRETEYLEKCQPKFCELNVVWSDRVKAKDRPGDIVGEKERSSDLGKQSGFCGE